MECEFHPKNKTSLRCNLCKKQICKECAIFVKENQYLCSSCAASKAAGDTLQGILEAEIQKKEELAAREKTVKKRLLVFRVLFLIFTLIVIGANIFLFLTRSPIEKGGPFIPSEDRVAAAIIIHAAIDEYSQQHNGHIPNSLYDLFEKHLKDRNFNLKDLNLFIYRKISSTSYELKPIIPSYIHAPDIVFTEKGIH
jgi:hypothetical protein